MGTAEHLATRTAAQSPDNPLGLATRTAVERVDGEGDLAGSPMSSAADDKLVQLITQEVMAALSRSGGAAGAAPKPASPLGQPAHIAPPIGACTGDYSKFPELAGRLHGGASAKPAAAPAPVQPSPLAAAAPPAAPPIVLTGIVTANQLQAAMDASPDGVALLSQDARLSPLANDLARLKVNKVRRVSPNEVAAGGAKEASTQGANLPWLWWIDGSCPVVNEVTSQRSARLRALSAARSPSSLAQVVRELAGAIRSHQVAGGLLFVHNAARAMCLANRCASIRAVVGTCGEAVEQGINELGANVLVIEYPHHGPRSTAAMVDRMLQQPPRVPPSVERELADLHRCG